MGPARTLTSRFFSAALLFGAAIRLAALVLPGTHDVAVWKIWSYVAASEGVARMYGVGGRPLDRRVVSFHGAETTVDYPPLALAELGVTGRIYRWATGGRYPDDARLIAAIKILLGAADVAIALTVYFALRRLADPSTARWATLAYWINPAVLIDAAALGYLDPLFVLPAIASTIAAALGWTIAAGALVGAALLTKPQAIVVVPAIAIGIWNTGRGTRAIALALAGGAASLTLGLAPIVRAGALPNFLQAIGRLGQHDMLSANACNLWWIVGYAIRAIDSMPDVGAWAAFTAPTRILAISRVVELGCPNPRTIGIVLTTIACAWALWTARRARDVWLTSALAAFLVHAYAVLSAQVHENHLFAAVAFLGVAASGRRAFTPVFLTISAIFALNLNLFYGISEDVGYRIPRGITIVDATVVLALVNCCALVWHAAVLRIECSRADEPRRAPAPASRPAPAVRSRSSESCT